MPLEEQIVEWATTRPVWQRSVLRHLATGQTFSSADYDRLIDAVLSFIHTFDPSFGFEHLPQTKAGDEPVTLLSIEQIEHVNALTPDKPLTFSDKGLTIIYGDNGSGKSGYARLLKRIARSRHREEQILSDVFKDNALAKPTATLAIKIGNPPKTIKWPDSSHQELKRMLFFDDDCGKAYVATESDFPYRPSALFVLEGLIDVCDVIRNRIDTKLQENGRATSVLPVVDEQISGTKIAHYLRALSGYSSVATLDDLLRDHDNLQGEIARLKEDEARLLVSDTTAERQRLSRQMAKLQVVRAHLDDLRGKIGKAAIATLQQELEQLSSLVEASRLAANSFASESLSGVGRTPWQTLWESARQFSTEVAYPERRFPVTDNSSRCVLCQQILDDEAKNRLIRFEDFVRGDIQRRVSTADLQSKTRAESINRLQTKPAVIESNLNDLENECGELVQEVKSLLDRYESARLGIFEAITKSATLPQLDLDDEEIKNSLSQEIDRTKTSADALSDSSTIKSKLSALSAQRKELELLQAAKDDRATIEKEIARRKQRERLEEVKTDAATGSITKKIMELSESNITEVVRDRFTRETARLNLERVTITKTRGDKGMLLHQPKLVGATQDVTVPRVLSEGEQTVLGLSAFFTEAELDESKSALIFDDPVSSLDHVRSPRVAARLAEFGETRQVVVFTHDTSFVLYLKKAAYAKEVPVAERTVSKSRAGDRKPGVCSLHHPWKAKDVTERLQQLKTDLARIKRERANWDDPKYEAEVATWAGNLSETWERIYSQEIVDPILFEGGMEVRPMMMKILVRFTETDNKQFQGSYGRVSVWVKRHDKSILTNYVPPEVDELEQELGFVEEWFKRVKKYKDN